MGMVTVAEIEARINRTVNSSAQTNAFIDDVSALVMAYVGSASATWLTNLTTPPAIKAVVALEVIRHLNVEPGIESEKIDVLATSYAYDGAVVALSQGAQEAIDFFLFGGGRRSKLARVGTLRMVVDRNRGPEVERKDEYDVWTITKGDAESIAATYTAAEGEPPLDLTGYTGTMFFKTRGQVLYQVEAVRDGNTFTVGLTPTQTTELAALYPLDYVLRIFSDDMSDVQTLIIGDLVILEA